MSNYTGDSGLLVCKANRIIESDIDKTKAAQSV